jgi:ABC-2 type transport system ATP-binding protein
MVIQLVNVSKDIKGKRILDNISLQFDPGKIYNIIGHNGCGKTMLLRLMAGLIAPSSGSIEKSPALHYSVVIETPGFIDDYTGYQNLHYLASIKKIIDDKQIVEVMHDVGLKGLEHVKVKKYSLGMKQKLAIAQAVMESPDLILLDEPFNALDTGSFKRIINILKQHRARGACIIIASHVAVGENSFYNETIKMENGKITSFCRY